MQVSKGVIIFIFSPLLINIINNFRTNGKHELKKGRGTKRLQAYAKEYQEDQQKL